MGLFTKKPLALLLAQAEDEGEQALKRTLGVAHLLALGIGVTIGAGIFVLTGQAAAQHAGPAIALSFVLAGLVCALAALCYAELAAMIPVSGSAYTYAYAAFGEVVAWIVAWDLIVEYLFAASAVAVGWSGYFVGLLRDVGVTVPPALSQAPLAFETGALVTTGAWLNVPAVALVAGAAGLLLSGTGRSARFNTIVVALKLTVILLVVVFGFLHVDPQNWTPFVPPREVDPATGAERFGLQGVFAAAGLIFFAYLGFEALSTAAQEARNPQRTMPIGILGSLAVCTVLYILVSLVLTGLAPLRVLDTAAPVYAAVDHVGTALAWLKPVVTVGAAVGLASTVLILLYGQSRIFYAMSRDGLLPPAFSRVHPRTRAPAFGIMVTATAAAILAGLFPIGLLGELVSVGTLMSFALICGGVVYLRFAHPDQPRPFRAPVGVVTGSLGVLACLGLVASLPGATFVRFVVWLAIGLAVYFGYARRRSVLGLRGAGAAG